jgi:hypothetical protein
MALFRRRPKDDSAAMEKLAEELGLTYTVETDDAHRAATTALPEVPLLREGTAANMSNILYGTIDDIATQLFTFRIQGYLDDPDTAQRSCVLFTFARAHLPELYLRPKGQLARLGEQLSDGGLSLGSPEFMARFAVQARDRHQALEVLSADLQAWMADGPPGDLNVEIQGPALLGHVPDVPWVAELHSLLDFMRGVVARIPPAAWHRS